VRHIIWTASALHAAVDFEQHPCARTGRWWAGAGHGGVREELQRDPEKVSVRTITSQVQAIVGISLLEILSSHSSNEVYLSQRDTPEWTRTPRRRRRSGGSGSGWRRSRLKNRVGPAKFLYTLLYPNTDRHRHRCQRDSNSISILSIGGARSIALLGDPNVPFNPCAG
jgi:linoleate 9S-lipoxygenase